jgi:acetylglutamate kinase
MTTLSVIKIGGNIIDDGPRLGAFLKAFAGLTGPRILVHGGGKLASGIGERLGIRPNYAAGRRITDAETLELVTMVYGGLINKQIVGALQSLGCQAIGLSGCDGRVIRGSKRPVRDIDYGFVGDLDERSINTGFIQTLLAAGLTPVFAPLSYDESSGGLLNTNADTIAQELARALAGLMPARLIYCFEKPGLLLNPEDDASLIASVNEAEYRQLLVEGIVKDGMVPKLENAFAAIRSGVEKVIIGRAEDLPQLIAGTAGTHIQ